MIGANKLDYLSLETFTEYSSLKLKLLGLYIISYKENWVLRIQPICNRKFKFSL
jgi:hypothetical protein